MNSAILCLALIAMPTSATAAQRAKPASDFVTGSELWNWFPIYRLYLDSFHDPRRTGLKSLVAPEFQLSYEHTMLMGKKAYAQLAEFSKGVEDADLEITVARLVVNGNQATAWTHMTWHMNDIAKKVPSAKNNGFNVTSVSWSSDWKQIWHRTSGSWKLTAMRRIDGKLPHGSVQFTLKSSGMKPATAPSASPSPSPAPASYIPPPRPAGR